MPLQRLYPQPPDTTETLEGEAGHWACAEMLHGRPIDIGLVAPNNVMLTEEMIEGAEMYVDDIFGVHPLAPLHIEERIDIPYVHAQNWGTPDCWLWHPHENRLYVWDYKFGHGFIEVFENYQLIDYACGILDAIGVDGRTDQAVEVVFRVVQPRSYHRDGTVREWRVTASMLRPYFNKLQMSAAIALAENPPTHVGPQCKYCSARHACEALARVAADAMDVATRSTPLELPPAALGLELRNLHRAQSMLNARVSGIEEAVLSHIKRGAAVPFYGVEQGAGRTVWAKPIAEVVALGDLMGINLRKDGAITPIQAKKAGIDSDVVKSYSNTPTGEIKLVSDNSSTARKVFGK